jgi:hypothetical protein
MVTAVNNGVRARRRINWRKGAVQSVMMCLIGTALRDSRGSAGADPITRYEPQY